MNTMQVSTPGEPPLLSSATPLAPLGSLPEDQEPITQPAHVVESILRKPRRVLYQLQQPGGGRVLVFTVILTLLCALLYGVVMGSFSMGEQLWAAPVKVAGGLLLAALVCLPSLYIFACLSGSQARFREVAGYAAGMALLMTLLLIGFAPVAWLFAQSTNYVSWMGFLHLCFWLIAVLFGVRFLRWGFIHSQARHTAGLYVWTLIFMLVMLQMTTALRPILGKADSFLPTEKRFFLVHWGEVIREDSKPEVRAD